MRPTTYLSALLTAAALACLAAGRERAGLRLLRMGAGIEERARRNPMR